MHHHDEAIERFLARTTRRPEVLGVLLTGSLARGSERVDSDVDLVVVVDETTWRQAVAAERIMFVEDDGAGYEGGYFDVKLSTPEQLAAAIHRADDPARRSLGEAKVLHDQGIGLAGSVRAIGAGATHDRGSAVASFVAQARLHGDYFLLQGLEHDDAFLAAHAAVHLGLAAGRALLAHVGAFHPGPKDLLATLTALPEPGPRFAAAITEVAGAPTSASARRLLDLVEQHLGASLAHDATLSRFVLDNELAWYHGGTPPEYR